MPNARLTKLILQRFKSYGEAPVEIDLRPITLLVGKNNSGKSSIIQALLLLKQTLDQARGNDPLTLHGSVPVPAGDLLELTHGWPAGDSGEGPDITLEWDSTVDVLEATATAQRPNSVELARQSGIEWMTLPPPRVTLKTTLNLSFYMHERRAALRRVSLTSTRIDSPNPIRNPSLMIRPTPDGKSDVVWNDSRGLRRLAVEWDHFLPFVSVDRRNVGPRHSDRGRANGFLILYDQPLADLRTILRGFAYLSSARLSPLPVYQHLGGESADLGMNGEWAVQVFHARGQDRFHYLPPIELDDAGCISVPAVVKECSLRVAVDDVFDRLGVPSRFSTEEIGSIGFRVLFGRASLFHVGRGISHLLPIVELGLLADPMATLDIGGDCSLATYIDKIREVKHIAVEEPESHLHPGVHSRLAHFFISTAMSGRQWIVETHSDHLVRRLRRLASASKAGSPFESWLCANVAVLEVEQTDGVTSVRTSKLKPTGEPSEEWPKDFMDQAVNEEDAIYLERMEKQPLSTDIDPSIEHRDQTEDTDKN